jgi:hypothetical protein
MDGVEIHNPYRLFGLTSAFNPETIDRFELTAGGFGAQYGDRLSSILVVDNRAGTRASRFAGSTSLSVTDANAVFEGSMPHGSWLVTGRRTYYDLFAERVTDNDLPSFADVQAKLVRDLGPGQQLSLFALRSRESTDASFDNNVPGDRLALRDASQNDVVSLSFSSPLGRRATTRTVAAWYRYGDALDVDGSVEDGAIRSNAVTAGAIGRSSIVFVRTVGVRDVSVRQNLALAITSNQTIDAGVEAHALHTSWGWRITGDRNTAEANGSSVLGGVGLPDLLDSSADTARAAAWIEDDVKLGSRVRLAGGIRADWNDLTGETLASPRARATIELSTRTRIRAAAGRYTQSPGYEKLLQADYFVDLSNVGSLGLTSERSNHWIAGLEHELGAGLRIRLEAYAKTFDRLIVGRLESAPEQAARVAQYDFPADLLSSVPRDPQITTVASNVASGQSHGADVYLEKRARSAQERVSGWVSYTWGRATMDAYGRRYPFDYDRRHSLAIVSTWRLLPRVHLGATWRAASGFPDTRPVGIRVQPVLAAGAVKGAPNSLVPQRDPRGLLMWTVDTGPVANINTARLPRYARLDLRATYSRSASSRWQFYIEMINALNRENAASLSAELDYDPTSDRPRLRLSPDEGLPRLPSFGLRVRF